MKFFRRTLILAGRSVFGKMAGRRTVKGLSISFRSARRRTMKRTGQNSNAPMQFVINATEQPPAFKLIRREAEARQHDDENQAIPDLQPPLDGFENLHSMQ